jgi:hypothetical protein
MIGKAKKQEAAQIEQLFRFMLNDFNMPFGSYLRYN